MNTRQERDRGGWLRSGRLRLLLSLLRVSVVVAATTTAYYLLPLDRDLDRNTATVLALGLLGIGALLALQAVSIAASSHPRLRAVEALTTAVPDTDTRAYSTSLAQTTLDAERTSPSA
ncbi:hypothetical protein ACTMTU_35410 [Streptomyces sp. OZ13]|uniref:hypothetical protein n=1 Tax=Streptomyces sp. OZ13 TaxID=3452210 RepID=UPI003F8BDDE5